jgi:EAL domain-containing protein (putative c-di-GMP-specific phosphodiesterase class I)
MIHDISEWVLGEACRQLRAWQTQYPCDPPLKMSMNMSSKEFLRRDFADKVATALVDTRLTPGSLAIEITESVLMEHTETAMTTMSALKNMGIEIHIDDFGTGYSSLSYLQHFPVDAIKIDRSFVSKMAQDGDNRKIVKAIVSLAQNLKLNVIAEGVEQNSELSAIKGMDCRYGQGFIFSQPLPPVALNAWLQDGGESFLMNRRDAKGSGKRDCGVS